MLLARAKGEALPAGVAVDTQGRPTTDPDAALAGAFLPWGGQRGSALALAVQLLGILAGSAPVIAEVGNYGLFFLVIDPEMLIPGGAFKAHVSELRRAVAASRPVAGGTAVRVPGDSSQRRRREALAAGVVTLDRRVHERILELCGK